MRSELTGLCDRIMRKSASTVFGTPRRHPLKTPSGIIGNINTFEHDGKQYIAVLSGVGGWAGIGLAGGLLQAEGAAAWQTAVAGERAPTDEQQAIATAGLGAVGGYAAWPTTPRWAGN